MNDKPILFLFVLLIYLNSFSAVTAPTIEYVCWQQGTIPGFAFESSSANCGDGRVSEHGTVSDEATGEKKIVCLLPAACVALSPKVRELLQKNIGVNTVKGLAKFSSSQIFQALHNSEYTGRFSYLSCEGSGKISKETNEITKGKIGLDEAKCPTVTECANSNQVFYNIQGVSPGLSDSLGTGQPEIKQVPTSPVGITN